MLKRLLEYFRRPVHKHQRELFVVGNMAFVKCIDPDCMMESLPWDVDKTKAERWKSDNGEKLKLLYELEEKRLQRRKALVLP